jgi:hypothetical protein
MWRGKALPCGHRIGFCDIKVADELGSQLREAKWISDARFTSTLYPLNTSDCEAYLNKRPSNPSTSQHALEILGRT